ncbi:transcriptional regulator, MarR family [Georgenia satyanarayanai]|uniref:Transcriptional regulator, MarR family n=1 Tax=Georgenia satyanarayanai TaxID=860221 RepID=A0A2Y9AA57_9MICO|nr:MarR family transcriptional regulator [Georgenia satyanarayanai]PYG00908.1 MarR family transcriptional regulator [Georgenia satyanarayanai]SSA39147.1 transcriptional regulator, MarR family [Georgenia satyanarayanai]
MLQGQDEVDRIVAAWGRERPDLDPRPLHVFSRVSRLSRRLDLARRRVFIDHALEGWEFDVLSALRRAGASYELTAGRLLNETLVSSGTMTNRIDRMVAHGYVVRAVGATDRRVVLVRLTPRGKETVDAAMADLLDSEQQLLAELEPEEAELLTSLLRRLLLPLDS